MKWFSRLPAAARAFIDELRGCGEREKMRKALKRIASSDGCGCFPVCECRSEAALRVAVDAMRSEAEEAIA